jgi:hypothetical protein
LFLNTLYYSILYEFNKTNSITGNPVRALSSDTVNTNLLGLSAYKKN